jgi:hypothetical protein
MTKAEIIEAINATITANDEKAITAELLANILIEMVNATPEGGSGGGSGNVKTIYLPMAEDLTSEEMAKNAELYNFAVAASTDLTLWDGVIVTWMGLPIYIEANNSNDGSNVSVSGTVSLTVGYDPDKMTLMGMAFNFTLNPDGSVEMS